MLYVLVYVVYVCLIKCVAYASCIIVKDIMYFQKKISSHTTFISFRKTSSPLESY